MHHHAPHTNPTPAAPSPVSAGRSNRKKALFGLATLAAAVVTLVAFNLSNTQTQGINRDDRNWSADAIIQGGVTTEKELVEKYDANASGVQAIFHHYGIQRSDLTRQTSQIQYGTVHQDGRVTVEGKVVATGAKSVSRKPFNDRAGNKPTAKTIGNTTLYEGPNMSIFVRSVDAYVFFRDGVFYRAIISSCANPVVAVPTEEPKKPAPKPPTPKPVPVYRCDTLTAESINRTHMRFTTTAVAQNGAQIVDYTYDFGDGNKQTINARIVEHEYTRPGNYTVKVTVNIRVDGQIQTINGPDCQVRVTVAEPPKEPAYKCDSLTAQAILSRDRAYTYNLVYTAESGATLTKVVYNFGDGNSETFPAASATNVEHVYAAPGNYTTTATLYFDVTLEGKVSERSVSCQTAITVPQPDMCPVPGKEHLPKNSPECEQPPIETPPELPQTGPLAWIGGGLGLGAIVAAGYYWNASRNNLRSTMLRR